MTMHRIDIEGYTAGELGGLAADDMDLLVRSQEPVAFHAGAGEVRVEFERDEESLEATVSLVDGGGEAEMETVVGLVHSYAMREGLQRVTWFVDVACTAANPRLKRSLERLGFGREHPGTQAAWVMEFMPHSV